MNPQVTKLKEEILQKARELEDIQNRCLHPSSTSEMIETHHNILGSWYDIKNYCPICDKIWMTGAPAAVNIDMTKAL